jgi:hypothetical protein
VVSSAAPGNLDPTKKGMASGADVYVVDYVNDFQDETLPLHLVEGVTITNSSYSDGCNVGYTIATQTVDEQLYENPTLMHVFFCRQQQRQRLRLRRRLPVGERNRWT